MAILLVWGIIATGGGAGFVNLPAFMITFGFSFFLLLGTFGTDYLKFIPDSILTIFATPLEPIPRYADIARFGSRYSVAGAVIATLVGFIQMLRNLNDPSTIGLGMAVALLPMLYALVLSEVIFAMLYKVYSDGGEPKDSPPLATITLAITLIALGVFFTLLFIMLFAFSNVGY